MAVVWFTKTEETEKFEKVQGENNKDEERQGEDNKGSQNNLLVKRDTRDKRDKNTTRVDSNQTRSAVLRGAEQATYMQVAGTRVDFGQTEAKSGSKPARNIVDQGREL